MVKQLSLITTYMHDYTAKNRKVSRSYGGHPSLKVAQSRKLIENLSKDCENIKWKGIASKEPLWSPRIICDETAIVPPPINNLRPNKFLLNLENKYPRLYAKLKKLPTNDLYPKKETHNSTYQIDYGSINEYPGGLYKADELEVQTTIKYVLKDPCHEIGRQKYNGLNCFVDNELASANKKSFITKSRLLGHWPPENKVHRMADDLSENRIQAMIKQFEVKTVCECPEDNPPTKKSCYE